MPPAPPSFRIVAAAPLRLRCFSSVRERESPLSSAVPLATLVVPGTAFGAGVGSTLLLPPPPKLHISITPFKNYVAPEIFRPGPPALCDRAETEEPQCRPLAVYIELLVRLRFGRRENISLLRQPRQNELKSPVRLKRRYRIHAFAHDTTSYA